MDREQSLVVAENVVNELAVLEANFENPPPNGLGREALVCIVADIIEATVDGSYNAESINEYFEDMEDYN